jgi:glutathione synthase/RimK-type ligase-like ATP-grasp enzyme
MRRMESILWCPVQFQRYIAGTNVRVHTVGTKVFASAISTDRTDYRYAELEGGRVEIYGIRLPERVEHACVNLAKHLGLSVAGIDLIMGTDGDIYCLEVNPSPAFTYYEDRTGQPIGENIARYLVNSISG